MGKYLPSTDSATSRAIKTFCQAILGFCIGLIYTVWLVPGVPVAVWAYVHTNFLQVLLMVGVPSGLSSLVWNTLRPSVKNY